VGFPVQAGCRVWCWCCEHWFILARFRGSKSR
jgi:hypothetical protein